MRQVFLKPSQASACHMTRLSTLFFFGQHFTTKFPNKLGFMIGPRDLNHNSMELVNGVTSGISLATAAALVLLF